MSDFHGRQSDKPEHRVNVLPCSKRNVWGEGNHEYPTFLRFF